MYEAAFNYSLLDKYPLRKLSNVIICFLVDNTVNFYQGEVDRILLCNKNSELYRTCGTGIILFQISFSFTSNKVLMQLNGAQKFPLNANLP